MMTGVSSLLLTFLIFSLLLQTAPTTANNPYATLSRRLKLDDNSSAPSSSPDCWGSLGRLQSCSRELAAFMLNGETHIGHDCCDAILVIGNQCWPDLLGALGFTAEEGGFLEGYCDGEEHGDDDHDAHKEHSKSLAKESLLP